MRFTLNAREPDSIAVAIVRPLSVKVIGVRVRGIAIRRGRPLAFGEYSAREPIADRNAFSKCACTSEFSRFWRDIQQRPG